MSVVQVSAVESTDPDDPEATLAFEWDCDICAQLGVALPASSRTSPTLVLAPGMLAVVNSSTVYTLSVNVSKPGSSESGIASVLIEVRAGKLPGVSIQARAKAKASPSEPLRLLGSASLDDGSGGTAAPLALGWSVEPSIDLSLASISSTGRMQPNLVILAGVLNPGTTYTFSLKATASGGREGEAKLAVKINTPPFGGAVEVSPPSGQELVTTFTVTAFNWIDDADDLPLRYGFEWCCGEAGGQPEVLGAAALSERLETSFAAGSLTVTALVFDQLGAKASRSAQVSVSEAQVDAAAVTQVQDAAEKALQNGDAKKATQASAALITSLNAKQQQQRQGGGGGRRLSLGISAVTGVREQVVRTLDAAAKASAPSPLGLKQSCGALSSTASFPDQLSGAAVSTGATMVAAVSAAAAAFTPDEPMEPGTELAIINSISSMLGSSSASSVAESKDAADALGSMQAAVGSTAGALLVGRLPGEKIDSVSSERVQLRAALDSPDVLEGSSFEAPPTADGNKSSSFQLPSGTIAASGGAAGEAVSVTLSVFQVNMHNSTNGIVPATPSTSVVLASANGSALRVRDLSEPIVISIPVKAVSAPVEGCGYPLNGSGLLCNGGGVCVAGQCYCDALHSGPNCSDVMQCRYWDNDISDWSSDGCTTVLPNVTALEPLDWVNGAPIFADSVLTCECTHLTEFAGLKFPSNADEVRRGDQWGGGSKLFEERAWPFTSVSPGLRALALGLPHSHLPSRTLPQLPWLLLALRFSFC